MSAHFEKIAVKEIRKETDDCVSILFDVPDELKEKFRYKAGQHITIRKIINGEEVRRSYSLCSSPLNDEWRIAVKKLDGGLFSAYANTQLQTGEVLELMPPIGNFSLDVNEKNSKQYVAIAAGSGITPIISNIKTALELEPKSTFTLIYGSRNLQSIIFKEELEAIKNKYLSRFSLIFILSREKTEAEINYGRIDAEKCAQLFGKIVSLKADEILICGPEEMIFTVRNFLLQNNVDYKNIHFELFTTPDQPIRTQTKRTPVQAATNGCNVTVKLDGRFFSFQLSFSSNESILDAALKQGADLPYACKGGVCCTCKARLLEGQIEMDVNYGLEQEDVEQGFILTCQSHPKTETVVVDYDVK